MNNEFETEKIDFTENGNFKKGKRKSDFRKKVEEAVAKMEVNTAIFIPLSQSKLSKVRYLESEIRRFEKEMWKEGLLTNDKRFKVRVFETEEKQGVKIYRIN